MKILFICKKNETYGFTTYSKHSSGLWNSTRFVAEALNILSFERHLDLSDAKCHVGGRPFQAPAGVVEVIDNNDIDRVVSEHKPDIVVIEALWVIPEKFDILKKLHPRVKWFVHLHSHIPFLALEGVAMYWLSGYAKRSIGIIANSQKSYDALRGYLYGDELIYLPNGYVGRPREARLAKKDCIDIACLGAVRPMKNQLLQAMAAIQFAKDIRKPLRFHINSSRVETGGNPVLTNIQALFEKTEGAELIHNPWREPEDFIEYLSEHIDIGMQVSLSETFNVVNADYVTAGVPSVVSKEIEWMSRWNKASDSSVESIVKAMRRIHNKRCLVKWNQKLLKTHSYMAIDMWVRFVEENA